jgi:hypothetical protein
MSEFRLIESLTYHSKPFIDIRLHCLDDYVFVCVGVWDVCVSACARSYMQDNGANLFEVVSDKVKLVTTGTCRRCTQNWIIKLCNSNL